jgi:hypothetical protein
MNKQAFWKLVGSTLGVITAVLTIIASSPDAAFAGEDGSGDSCGGSGPQLCYVKTTCTGTYPNEHCESEYVYYNPCPPAA